MKLFKLKIKGMNNFWISFNLRKLKAVLAVNNSINLLIKITMIISLRIINQSIEVSLIKMKNAKDLLHSQRNLFLSIILIQKM